MQSLYLQLSDQQLSAQVPDFNKAHAWSYSRNKQSSINYTGWNGNLKEVEKG